MNNKMKLISWEEAQRELGISKRTLGRRMDALPPPAVISRWTSRGWCMDVKDFERIKKLNAGK